MGKVKSLDEVAKITARLKKQGKKIGLITGCFDIVHLGHLRMFQFAKRNVDILLVGLDNDSNVKIAKGKNRPLNNFKRRAEFLSEFASVDFIFLIRGQFDFGSKEAEAVHQKLLEKLKPTHLITHMRCDHYWRRKNALSKELGIIFLLDRSKKINSSGNIIKTMESEL